VPTLPSSSASSLAIGTTAGFVSTLSHGAGPIVTLYLLQERLDKRVLVGTLLLFFLLVNLAKLPTFIALGWINASTLRDSLWTIPLLPIGTLAGAWLHRRVAEKPFILVMYVATAATAGHMNWKAGLGLLSSALVFFFWLGSAKRRLERRRARVGPSLK
jgi:uncharacterized membrane protein YfcA